MSDKRELIARLRDECSRRISRKHFSLADAEMVAACTAGADAIQRELDATAAPAHTCDFTDGLDRDCPSCHPATAAPVVVGEDMVRRARGHMMAPITNPEAWPPGYADGFNDAAALAIEQLPAALTAAMAGD